MSFITLNANLSSATQQLGSVEGDLLSLVDTNLILDTAGAVLLNRIRTRYLAETDPDGVPWIPSKAGLRRRLIGGTGTLFETGTMFHSIQLHKVNDTERSISTDVPYAGYHQNGKGQVKRVFLGFSSEDQDVYTAVVSNLLARAVASHS